MKTGKKQASKQKPKHSVSKYVWKPGECGNPNGRPKLSKELKESRKILTDNFQRIVFDLAQMPYHRIRTISMSDNANGWESVIATLFRQAACGDDDARKELFNRTMGKTKEHVELEGNVAFTFVDFVKQMENDEKVVTPFEDEESV